MVQSKTEGLLSKFLRYLDPGVISLAPGRHLGILFSRKRQVTALDGYVAVQPLQELRLLEIVSPVLLESPQKELLRIVMFGERTRRAGNLHEFPEERELGTNGAESGRSKRTREFRWPSTACG